MLNYFLNFNILCDMPEKWQISFQDPASSILEGIIYFHNDLWFFLIVIGSLVFWMFFRCIYFFDEEKNKVPSKVIHGTTIEVIWTIMPAFVLLLVAIPSFALLYAMDELIEPTFTLKVVGHQWYWHYEYTDLDSADGVLRFDSYMISESDSAFTNNSLRLLEVDNRVVLPINTHIRVLITAADVLHCWAVPSLGLKLDACPGRLNQTSVYIKRPGIYYGQCSEICGVNHGFMPIVVEAVDTLSFIKWMISKQSD